MGRFTKWLFDHNPRTGRMILEDGTFINEADFLDGTLKGVKAYVVQPYTEANVKRGLQYYVRMAWPLDDPIAGNTSRKILFQTGAKQVLVKRREFNYVGEELQIELFEGPSGVTGGTAFPVNNWNEVSPVPSTVTVTKNVSTTDDGTPLESEPEYFFGSTTGFNRQPASIPIGRERIIPPNSTFLVVISNNNGADARCQYFLDFYEGDTDI